MLFSLVKRLIHRQLTDDSHMTISTQSLLLIIGASYGWEWGSRRGPIIRSHSSSLVASGTQTWLAGKSTICRWFSHYKLHLLRGFPIFSYDFPMIFLILGGFPSHACHAATRRDTWRISPTTCASLETSWSGIPPRWNALTWHRSLGKSGNHGDGDGDCWMVLTWRRIDYAYVCDVYTYIYIYICMDMIYVYDTCICMYVYIYIYLCISMYTYM